jgi:hypothetical protein
MQEDSASQSVITSREPEPATDYFRGVFNWTAEFEKAQQYFRTQNRAST